MPEPATPNPPTGQLLTVVTRIDSGDYTISVGVEGGIASLRPVGRAYGGGGMLPEAFATLWAGSPHVNAAARRLVKAIEGEPSIAGCSPVLRLALAQLEGALDAATPRIGLQIGTK